MKRVTKGMTGRIIELCTRNKSSDLEDRLEADVEEFALRGLRGLAVATEDVTSNDAAGEGNGFELIGLLAIFDPPRDDTKQTIDDAQALGVKVRSRRHRGLLARSLTPASLTMCRSRWSPATTSRSQRRRVDDSAWETTCTRPRSSQMVRPSVASTATWTT